MSQSAIEKVRAMSDRELFLYFSGTALYEDPEMTLAVCQEVENREAAKAGRKPVVIAFEELKGNCVGVAEPNGRIVLNSIYLDPEVRGYLPPASLLNTILHEGRHQWQYIVGTKEDSGVPESVWLMMQVDNHCYVSDSETAIDIGIRPKDVQTTLEYVMQENEMDARLYAIKRMQEIEKIIGPDPAFQIQIRRAQMDEVRYITMLLENCSEEQYQKLERLRLKRYQQKAEYYRRRGYTLPKLPDNFRCYGNIWMIQHIVGPVMGALLQTMLPINRIPGEAEWMLYKLFEIARGFAMNGKPLEEPQELLDLALQEGFVEEFGLADIKATKKMEKAPGL